MVDIDLESLTLEQLEWLQKAVDKTVKGYKDRKRRETIGKMEALAKEAGFSMAELMEAPKKTVAAKYQHPENPTITWSGRGRKPKWFEEALASGVKEEDLLIVKA